MRDGLHWEGSFDREGWVATDHFIMRDRLHWEGLFDHTGLGGTDHINISIIDAKMITKSQYKLTTPVNGENNMFKWKSMI